MNSSGVDGGILSLRQYVRRTDFIHVMNSISSLVLPISFCQELEEKKVEDTSQTATRTQKRAKTVYLGLDWCSKISFQTQ